MRHVLVLRFLHGRYHHDLCPIVETSVPRRQPELPFSTAVKADG